MSYDAKLEAGSRGRDRTCTTSVNNRARYHYATLEGATAEAELFRDLESNQDDHDQSVAGFPLPHPGERDWYRRRDSNPHSKFGRLTC